MGGYVCLILISDSDWLALAHKHTRILFNVRENVNDTTHSIRPVTILWKYLLRHNISSDINGKTPNEMGLEYTALSRVFLYVLFFILISLRPFKPSRKLQLFRRFFEQRIRLLRIICFRFRRVVGVYLFRYTTYKIREALFKVGLHDNL